MLTVANRIDMIELYYSVFTAYKLLILVVVVHHCSPKITTQKTVVCVVSTMAHGATAVVHGAGSRAGISRRPLKNLKSFLLT